MAIDDSETEALLLRVEKGDESALTSLFQRDRDRLWRMVAVRMDPRLAARIDPSDVIQETITEASRRLPAYLKRREIPFYPWLRQIAWERLVQMHRRHVEAEKRSVRREVRWKLSDESVMQLAERLQMRGSGPSARLLREELRQRVRNALDQLPTRDREVVVLRHLEQLQYKEIAVVLDISVAAIQSRYRRAVERLHDLLSDPSSEDR